MGPKRKQSSSLSVIPFAPGFSPPSQHEVKAALGTFPWHSNDNKAHLLREALVNRYDGDSSKEILQQIDNQRLYQELDDNGQPFWEDFPLLKHVEDWVAKYNEASQTFDEYKDVLLPRRVDFRQHAVKKSVIYLLPINSANDGNTAASKNWPDYAPNLEKLANWIEAYYNRTVKILPSSVVFPNSQPRKGGSELCFQLLDPVVENNDTPATCMKSWNIRGRVDPTGDTGKYQIQGEAFLELMSCVKSNYGKWMKTSRQSFQDKCNLLHPNLEDAIAFVGITMTDLYAADTDLFLAGYASFLSECSVISFSRYHPYLKMGDCDWYDYGYWNKSSADPNFPADRRRYKVTNEPPSADSMDPKAKVEFFRRAGKLMLHEIGHNFQLPHCVYHSCIMNGSGHIKQDIESSPMICNICLRKIQLRLGIDIVERYRKLLKVYQDNDMEFEATWVARRLAFVEKSLSDAVDVVEILSD